MKTIIIIMLCMSAFVVGCSKSDTILNPCDTEVTNNNFVFQNPYELAIITRNYKGGEYKGGYIVESIKKDQSGTISIYIADTDVSGIIDSAMQVLHHPVILLKQDSTTLAFVDGDTEVLLVGSDDCTQMLKDIYDWLN